MSSALFARLATGLALLGGFAGCAREHAAHEALAVEHHASSGGVVLAAASAEVSPAVTERPHAGPASLVVPRAPRAIVPSTEFDVALWGGAVNTHTLLDRAGHGAVPVSEARFLWGQGKLYVSFYAGDLDLQIQARKHDGPAWKDDAAVLDFPGADGSERLIVASAIGVVSDGVCPAGIFELGDPRCRLGWESHALATADYDGTINQTGDRDEEWNVELAIPLAALGIERPAPGTRIAFRLRRCEVAYDGPRQCGRFGTEEMPAELVLQ
jgi:hypothetical protein